MEKTFAGRTVLGLLLTLCLPFATAHAQGTAFTYQGRLLAGSAPANGSYDVAFTLYATNPAGAPLAGPVTNAAITVSNGLFATLVDFGNAYTNAGNWLELAVSTNGANSFTRLVPRQQLTPVPYAVMAENVSGSVPASQVAGTIPLGQLPTGVALLNGGNTFNGNQVVSSGNVGVGTASPSTQLANTANNLFGTDGYGLGYQSLGWYSDGFGYTAGFYNPGNSSAGSGVSIGIAGTSARILDLYSGGNNSVMAVNGNGRVGIGTTTPGTALQVNGIVTATGFAGDGSGLTNLATSMVSWVQTNGQSLAISKLLLIDSCTNAKPALGVFVIMASASFTVAASSPTVDVALDLYDGSTMVDEAAQTSSATSGNASVSLNWVVPVTAAGGTEVFKTYVYGSGGGTISLNSHNLTVMFFPQASH